MNRLDILKRRNKGKTKIKAYRNLFEDLPDKIWFDLEETDSILKMHQQNLKESTIRETEYVDGKAIFIESDLLREVYTKLQMDSNSYIFTDDYRYCGLFLTNSKSAFQIAFDIAKKDNGNTSFIIDEEFKFSFTINYYDSTHNDYPNKFDIQRVLKRNSLDGNGSE